MRAERVPTGEAAAFARIALDAFLGVGCSGLADDMASIGLRLAFGRAARLASFERIPVPGNDEAHPRPTGTRGPLAPCADVVEHVSQAG